MGRGFLDQGAPAMRERHVYPAEKIPEVDLLLDRTWLNSIYPRSVETDEECRGATSTVRNNAEIPTLLRT
jgi:hypothetical protein